MTVAEVWGRVQGRDVLPLTHDGDDWCFPIPEGLTGQLVCEFWAEDEAGNVGYRAALLTVAGGAIKCWRWLDSGCDCIMLASRRPAVTIVADRTEASMRCDRPVMADASSRPSCILRPHICPQSEA